MSVQFTDTNSPTQLQGKLFSPVHILIGSMLGGFPTGIYFVIKNYGSFEEIQKRNLALIIGILFTIGYLFFTLLIPPRASQGFLLSSIIGFILAILTKKYLQNNEILLSPENAKVNAFVADKEIRQSNWHFVGGIFGGMIVSYSLAFILGAIMMTLGFEIS
jgi:hypothetical protein